MKQIVFTFLLFFVLANGKGQDTIYYEDKFLECLIVKIDKENIFYKKCLLSNCDFKYDTLWNKLDLENLYVAKQNGIETMEIKYIKRYSQPRHELHKKDFHSKSTVDECGNLDKKTDEFDGTITISYQVSSESEISFIKVIRKGISTYYLSIRIKESGTYRGKGVALLLGDGQKISKASEKVDSDYSSGNFYTSAFMKLTPADLKTIKQSNSMKYKLYISKGESSYNKSMLDCLLKAK